MSSKRKRTAKKKIVLPGSLTEKIRALKDLEGGVPISMIAKRQNVPVSSIRGWVTEVRNLSKLEAEQRRAKPKPKKCASKTENELVNKAVWIWYKQKRLLSPGVHLQGPVIRAQAKNFNHLINKLQGTDETFEASEEWLDRWRKSNNLGYFNDKEVSSDDDVRKAYKVEFLDFLATEQLTADQVFYCDTMFVNSKGLPKKAELGRESGNAERDPLELEIDEDVDVESTHCENNNNNNTNNNNNNLDSIVKERITMMTCSNASGKFKLPLLVSSPSTRRIYDIFQTWYNLEFKPRVCGYLADQQLPNKKAVLFIDDSLMGSPVALTEDDSDDRISIRYFPRNVTIFRSPEDDYSLEIKKSVKLSFMEYVLQIVQSSSVGQTLDKIFNQVPSMNFINWASKAWRGISEAAIRKSWESLMNDIDKPSSRYGGIELSLLKEEREDDTISSTVKQFYEVIHKMNPIVKQEEVDDRSLITINKFHEVLHNAVQWNDISLSDVFAWFNSSVTIEDCLTDDEIVDLVISGNTNTDSANNDSANNDSANNDSANNDSASNDSANNDNTNNDNTNNSSSSSSSSTSSSSSSTTTTAPTIPTRVSAFAARKAVEILIKYSQQNNLKEASNYFHMFKRDLSTIESEKKSSGVVLM